MMTVRLLLTLICFHLLLHFSFGQAFRDRHSTNLDDGWLSCQSSANPNTIRGNSHWIMYNLGSVYSLTTSKIWNFNTPQRINSYDNNTYGQSILKGKLEDGFNEMVVDISINGTTWQELGKFTIPKAPGSSFYEGVSGPDFGGKLAKYILITGISNHGGSCFGLGEVRFNGAETIVCYEVEQHPNANISILPNPFSQHASIQLTGFASGSAQVEIYDVTGRKLKYFDIEIGHATYTFTLTADDFENGIYILKIVQNTIVKTSKFEIIH